MGCFHTGQQACLVGDKLCALFCFGSICLHNVMWMYSHLQPGLSQFEQNLWFYLSAWCEVDVFSPVLPGLSQFEQNVVRQSSPADLVLSPSALL